MPTDADWNTVDESSIESFPASDPPGWIRAHAVAEHPDAPAASSGPHLRRAKRIALGILAAVATLAFLVIARYRRTA